VATATIVARLIPHLEDWLKKVDNTYTESYTAHSDVHLTNVVGLIIQTEGIVRCLGTDSEAWKEMSQFIKSHPPDSYRSLSARRCMNLLSEISKLFAPQA
jgi:hypothetical protein